MPETPEKFFSLKEVQQHNSEKDAWIVIGGKVYDVSSFLDDHPGGGDVIMSVVGTDATEAFEDVSHSLEARELLKEFEIGRIGNCKQQKGNQESSDKLFDKQWWLIAAATGAVVLSLIAYSLFQ